MPIRSSVLFHGGRAWALARLLLTLAAGCAAMEDPGGGAAPRDCAARCATKARACGDPEALIPAACAQVCGVITAEQLGCLERLACGEDLRSCGIGGGGGAEDMRNGGGAADLRPREQLPQGADCACGSGTSSVAMCQGTSGPCQPQLTCLAFNGRGTCTRRCQADGDCGAGFVCAHTTFNQFDVGHWCQRQ
jgi:hypothetical protein